jgi:hypothetical protein
MMTRCVGDDTDRPIAAMIAVRLAAYHNIHAINA